MEKRGFHMKREARRTPGASLHIIFPGFYIEAPFVRITSE
jgi:hypothetical protein